jgi:hypothetical protein
MAVGGFVALLDAESGDYPEESDGGDEAEGYSGIVRGERDGDEVDGERSPVLELHGAVGVFEGAFGALAGADGETQEHEAEAGDEQRGRVDGYGEAVIGFLVNVGGEERKQREAEEPDEVGPEDVGRGFAKAMDQQMVVDPVDADEGEGERVDGDAGSDGDESRKAVCEGDFEVEHHDGDNDGDDSVGEGFETGWREGCGHKALGDMGGRIQRVIVVRLGGYPPSPLIL